MSLTIYGIPASRAVRPLWAAAELGLDFEHINLAYQGGGTHTPEFLALNPNGHIPLDHALHGAAGAAGGESHGSGLTLQAGPNRVVPSTEQTVCVQRRSEALGYRYMKRRSIRVRNR